MNDYARNNGPSWAVVIVLLIVFWPVGLYLLIKKLSADKTAAINSGGKGLKTAGIVLLVIAGFGFLGFVTSAAEQGMQSGDLGALIFLSFFAVGGFASLRKSKKVEEEAKDIKQYLAMIVNGNVRQLDAIAATTGKSYNAVCSDVKNMIAKGYLKNAYIDEGMREIVIPTATPSAATQNIVQSPSVNSAPAQPKIVACPCCGANNTIIGNLGECEYCGSPLK